MRWLRFSVAGLMAIVLLLALGLAALRANSEFWASAIFTAVVILLSASVVGAIVARGLTQSTSTGMAVFGWIYLVIAFGPWAKDTIGSPPLLTSALLEYLQDYVVSDTPYLVAVQQSRTSNAAYSLRGKGPQGGAPAARLIDVTPYWHTGHSLGAFLFGILGAVGGRLMAPPNRKTESAAG